MQFRHWGIRLALGFVFCVSALGCHLTDTFVAQATITPTRTRTVKPTFTPIPPTSTPVPPSPTALPSPTLKPTVRPTPRPPTKPPPTKPPAPPPPSGPTASPYEWHVNPPGCEHSGLTYIKGAIYSNKNDPGSRTSGVRVALGAADGANQYVPPVTSDDNGEYTFILSDPGTPGRVGTWYVWIIDSNGRRISDIGGPMNTNNLAPDAPGTCWHGWVDFWK